MAGANGDVTKVEQVEPPEEKEKSFYEIEENLVKLCEFLRSNEGPAVREAVEMDKRVYYLKGEKLVNFMVEPKKGSKWPKKSPTIQGASRSNSCLQRTLSRAIHTSV